LNPRILAALLILAIHPASEPPPEDYLRAVVRVSAGLYHVDPSLACCIVEHESHWDLHAVGDNGAAVSLWQWHEESIRVALRDMGVTWNWEKNGDPRLSPWMSSLAACHALGENWAWWPTREVCEVYPGEACESCPEEVCEP